MHRNTWARTVCSASSSVAGTLVRTMYRPSRAASAVMASVLRRQANAVSVMSSSKCLAILYWAMTLPTRRAIFSLPVRRRFSRCVAPTMGASSASVACSSTSRLCARSSAKRSLRHTISRSPGYASQRISAKSVSSNIERCTAPELTSARIAGARNALIQSSPAGATSSPMRASVSIPRSPTSTTRERPKRQRSLSICAPTVWGSAVLARRLRRRPGTRRGCTAGRRRFATCRACHRGSRRAGPADSTAPRSRWRSGRRAPAHRRSSGVGPSVARWGSGVRAASPWRRRAHLR